MIKLGNKVRDNITGFDGIATGRCVYLFGCAQILVSPDRLDKDGAEIKGVWFDEQRIETVEERTVAVSAESSATSGGPQRDAPSRG